MSILDSLSAAKRSTSDKRPATSAYELNIDLCLMMCVDLRPFSMVSDKGFATFCAKNIPAMALPDESTLRRGALQDLYRTLKVHVKNQLKSVVDSGGCLCIMFDGWTDKYFGNPYLGLRVSFVDPATCTSHVKTISVKIVESHTGEQLASHIRQELDDFGIGRDVCLYSTHDGAMNMMKCSRLLEVKAVTHCIAHNIHLLLTADSVYMISDVVELLKKCKQIVTCLHFKGCLLTDESAKAADRQLMEILLDKIERAKEDISLDERFSDGIVEHDEFEDTPRQESGIDIQTTVPAAHVHRHKTLKQEIPTRYRPNYFMTQCLSVKLLCRKF
jgi:hypothetical protein